MATTSPEPGVCLLGAQRVRNKLRTSPTRAHRGDPSVRWALLVEWIVAHSRKVLRGASFQNRGVRREGGLTRPERSLGPPPGPDRGQPDPQQAVGPAQPGPRDHSFVHRELVAQ